MEALVCRLDPANSSLPRLDARAALMEGRHEQAAAALLELLKKEKDKEQRQEFLVLYLDSMSAADKVLEGYQSAPDAEAAFMYLTGGDEEEGAVDPDQLKRLLELHRRRAPQDPWGAYQAALQLQGEGKHDAALEELRKAAALVKKTPDEDGEAGVAQSIRYQQIVTVQEAGRGMEAYDSIPPADETFRTLADAYQRDESQTEDLLALIARHRVVRPRDPWLDYYTAVVDM